jgi:mercuric reductase
MVTCARTWHTHTDHAEGRTFNVKSFDLVIVGGGAAAFGAAINANDLGAQTALVNRGLPLGGTCVNVGCVPSKTLLWAGEVLHLARTHGIPGIDVAIGGIDFGAIVRDELALVERLRREKYENVLRHLEHVSFIDGQARFTSGREIEVNGEAVTAPKFVVASGSTATVPQIPGLREAGYVTHVEALALQQRPGSLVVIGGGPLGLEFAQMYARFGTHVTILQRAPVLFPRTEHVLAERLAAILRAEGLTIVTNAHIERVHTAGATKIVTYTADGQSRSAAADELLLASGKTPNTAALDPATARIGTDDRGAIRVQPHLQTSNPDVYAAGDVTNLPKRLEITAGREGTLAAENALRGSTKRIDYDAVPYTVFTDPQLAGVGVTEEQQMERLGVCACRTVPLSQVPKAIIMKRTEGLIKMAIHPQTGQIMGVHILAPQAGELVAEAMMLVKNRHTIDDVIDSLPMFPTLSESIKLVALAFTRDISRLSCCT